MSHKLSGPMVAPLSGETKQLVVLLHGYGSDGDDLISLAQYWREMLPDAMFIAPNGPSPCDINPAGYQWFPLDLDREISRLVGSEKIRPVVLEFLEDLWAETGLGAKDTLLGGFSQGAMVALDVGLRLPETLMGIIGFSGGVIDSAEVKNLIKSKPAVCLVHGGEDDVVPAGMSVRGSQALKAEGVEVDLHISPGVGHSIAPDGMEVANAFISRVAKAS